MKQRIEIIDTTLRDGEQTDGVNFNAFEKRQIANILLLQLGVDRIEIASARVSRGEKKIVREVLEWAAEKKADDRIEILGFADHRASADWIFESGGRVMNLLAKGSRRHCEEQLRKSLTDHLTDIEKTLAHAIDLGLRVNVYLEDWSNGFLNSNDYVRDMVAALLDLPVNRLLLPDTLGIMSPEEVYAGINDCLQTFPMAKIDFHAHNDYGLGVANTLAAVRAGATGVHVTINGMGERAGNAPLEAVIAALHDKLGVQTTINEKAINDASNMVATFSRKRIAFNQPIVGQDVYTHTAGIHADGDKKSQLYSNPILPDRFGRQRVYALGKLSGKASVTNNLEMLGIKLTADREEELLRRIVELSEQKNKVTADDLPYLIEDLFGSFTVRNIKINNAQIHTRLGYQPFADVELEYEDHIYRETACGNGGYDAFMKALTKICDRIHLELPSLVDYEVRIPPGGDTDALVETVISWRIQNSGKRFTTIGVDSDQIVAAIKATEKMLNRLLVQESEEMNGANGGGEPDSSGKTPLPPSGHPTSEC